MSERKVWLVTTGEYSDYSVWGAFSTEAAAEEYIKAFLDRYHARIEEFPLDPMVKEMREGYQTFWLRMEVDGSVLKDPEPRPLQEEAKGMQRWNAHLKGDHFEGWVTAKDAKHAIKIANEQRLQLLAAPPP